MNDLSRSARLKRSAAVPAAVVGASRPHLPRARSAFDRLTAGSRQLHDAWVCEILPSQPGFELVLHVSGGMNFWNRESRKRFDRGKH